MRVLNRLDDRVVPEVSRALRGIGRFAVAGATATGSPGRALAAVVRRFAVAAAAVILVVVAVLLIEITGGDQRSPVRPRASTVVPPLTGQRLGPATGSSVSSYLGSARQRLQQLSTLPDTQQVTAVVDLTGYLTPQAVTSSLVRPGMQFRDAFARVPSVANAAIHALQVGSNADIGSLLAAAQSNARAVVNQYRAELAAESRQPSRRLQDAINAAAPVAAQAGVDARGLTPTCGCVFALLVTGPVGQVRSLASVPDVRVIDPAPPSTSLRQLQVVPLEPQVTGTVPQVQFAGE